MAQQTAVQFVFEHIQNVHKMNWDILFLHAIEMEKEQIVAARMNGMTDDELSHVNAETYYNETYNKM